MINKILKCAAFAAAAVFIFFGSVKSDVFHFESCRYVKRIYQENLISFETRQEALESGYRPCKVCKP